LDEGIAHAIVGDSLQGAMKAVHFEDARLALQKAGYNIGDQVLTRKLHPMTGQGFWDKTIDEFRMVCYGPGEYIQPHYHDIEEKFDITTGGCHVWTSQDEGATWLYSYCGPGAFVVSGGAWHALVAGNNGLCMHVYRDSIRTSNWLDAKHSAQWSPTLVYKVTIEELKIETERVLQDK
jgi:hypothetical protein